ncbi:Spherulation-specific family 4 [Blastococcus fimeti]|nr:Spherulation-specific family 4 [Blastococcus fimeti]
MTTSRLGLPWYVHPAEDPAAWAALAARRPRPSFAVVNVHDGPGAAGDEWYPEALAQLRTVRLLGYVDVDYGRRSPDDVQADVQAWLTRYKVGGVMFDQFPTDAASIERCSTYVNAARRSGALFVVGNPGTVPHLGHLAMLDVACVFEGTAESYADYRPPPGLSRVPRGRVWHLVHSCPPDELAAVSARTARLGAGHAFVTDRGMPHPWGGFPIAESQVGDLQGSAS